MIVGKKVYDVTQYLDDHPGGPEVITSLEDFPDKTEGFEETGHSQEAIDDLEKLCIGTLEELAASEAELETKEVAAVGNDGMVGDKEPQADFGETRADDSEYGQFTYVAMAAGTVALAGIWLNRNKLRRMLFG